MHQIQPVQNPHDQQILSTFGIGPSEIIHQDGRYWLTAEQIGTALGYSEPRKSIVNLFNKNREELAPYQAVISLMTTSSDDGRGGGVKDVTIFNTDGAMLISMMACTPRASAFRREVLALLKRWEAGEFVHVSRVRQMADDAASAIVSAIAASPVMTADRYRNLVRYKTMGLSAREISLLLGVSKTTVLRFTSKNHFGGQAGLVRIGGRA
jgi:hypothetical protein